MYASVFKVAVSCRFYNRNVVCTSLLPHTCYMTRPSYCTIKLFKDAAYPIARRFVASNILNSAFFHKRPFFIFQPLSSYADFACRPLCENTEEMNTASLIFFCFRPHV